jgi:hypothetical protein
MSLHYSFNDHFINIYTYVYIYMCVCVCVCVCGRGRARACVLSFKYRWIKDIRNYYDILKNKSNVY